MIRYRHTNMFMELLGMDKLHASHRSWIGGKRFFYPGKRFHGPSMHRGAPKIETDHCDEFGVRKPLVQNRFPPTFATFTVTGFGGRITLLAQGHGLGLLQKADEMCVTTSSCWTALFATSYIMDNSMGNERGAWQDEARE